MSEDLHVEYKEARNTLPKSLFDSVCAFLNTDGGAVYLGIRDDGRVTGVEPEAVARLKRQIADISNNPQKLDPPYLLFPKEETREGKTVILLQVPLSSQIHKHNGEIYLRSEDGDYRVKSTQQLAGLLNRKLGIFPEQTPLPACSMQDLRPDLFEKARKLMRARNQKHPWLSLTDGELLHVAGLYAESSTLDAPVLTLAAVLLFGNDLAIQRAAPAYKFDCLLRRRHLDRYDDRLIIRTNLIDAYDQMMSFVEKHLNDPFYLEGDISISLRERIFREAISNIIAHRDYRNASPGRLMIYENRVILDNPATQYFHQPITPDNLASHPKNPSICKFMIQLGRFDELGSGVINIHKYLPAYTNGAQPLFEDTREGFRLTLPLSLSMDPTNKASVSGLESGPQLSPVGEQVDEQVDEQVSEQVDEQVSEQVKAILKAAESAPRSKQELLKAAGFTSVYLNYKRHILPLLEQELIERTLPEKPTSRLQKYRLTEKGRSLLTLPLSLSTDLPNKTPVSRLESRAQLGSVSEQVDEQVSEKADEQVSEQVKAILKAAESAPRSKQELLKAAGFTSVYLNYKRHILPLLEQELIERTLPEKPTSRLQKYRLTEKGRSLLQ